MHVVDANVLLYAVNRTSERHQAARRWLDEALNGAETVGFAWVVVLAFVRLATHRAVFANPLSPDEALSVVRRWLAQPSATIVEATPRHLDVLSALLVSSGTAGNLVTDAHVASLAIEHGGQVVSFDTDFARFHELRWTSPGEV
jgi:uncharacterized protein